jgi:hypothetical protein
MNKKPHFQVAIATPGSLLTAGYVKSLLRTVGTLDQEGISWNFLNAGGSLIAMVREELIGGYDTNNVNMREPHSGQFTYDKIMWIDSDIEWDITDFFKLFNSNKDIISGCYLMEDRHIPIYNQPRGGMMPEQLLDKYKEPFKVAGCGFGFLCVKSGVFEKMPRPWFGPVAVPNYDEKTNKKTEDFILIGEDLSWCTKAINAGFDIWVDPEVRVLHQKTFKLHWARDMQQMQGMNVR